MSNCEGLKEVRTMAMWEVILVLMQEEVVNLGAILNLDCETADLLSSFTKRIWFEKKTKMAEVSMSISW